MPYIPPGLRAKLAAEAGGAAVEQAASAERDANPPVRQPSGPPKAIQPNEQGSIGFGPRSPKVPTAAQAEAAKAAKRERPLGGWASSAPLGDISNGDGRAADASSDNLSSRQITSGYTLTLATIEKIFGTQTEGTLTCFRDVLSDGRRPSPWSWSGAGTHHIDSALSPEEHAQQWRDNEMRRRQKAQGRAEREGITDPVVFPPIEDAAREELEQFVLWKGVAEEGQAHSKPHLLSRITVWDPKTHPWFEPYRKAAPSPVYAIRNALGLQKAKKSKKKGQQQQKGFEEDDGLEGISESVRRFAAEISAEIAAEKAAEAAAAEAAKEPAADPAAESNADETEAPADQDDTGAADTATASQSAPKPLQKTAKELAPNGELWIHSNLEGLLPPKALAELNSYRAASRDSKRREFEAYVNPTSSVDATTEETVADEPQHPIFQKTFYFHEDYDGYAPNFFRPIPCYVSSDTFGGNKQQRGKKGGGSALSQDRSGNGSMEFLGWFQFTSIKLVPPQSPELVRMMEVKAAKQHGNPQRRNEKALGYVWARLGLERIRGDTVDTKSAAEGGEDSQVQLLNPRRVEGGPDGVEMYLAKLGSLPRRHEQH